jgi:hypothetical protein
VPPFSSQEEAGQFGPDEQPTEELPVLELAPEHSADPGLRAASRPQSARLRGSPGRRPSEHEEATH